jgi:hypothetical protein
MSDSILQIRSEVESISARMKLQNPLFLGARSGTISRDDVERYLNNVFWVFTNTPSSLRLAVARAKELGKDDLLDFFMEKIRDEDGHDIWPQQDLKSLGLRKAVPNNGMITPETEALLAFGRQLIQEEPELFLAYMFCFEYMTVLLGPELLSDLERNCGIPRRSITAIDHHIELDKDHVDDDLGIIKGINPDPGLTSRLVEATRHTMTLLSAALGSYVRVQ